MQESLLVQGLHVNFKSTKDAGTLTTTLNISMPLQQIIPLYPTTVPEDLEYIQPRPYQLWNFDDTYFDLKRIMDKIGLYL